jgi:preprotein translocase subunit SecA
MFASFAKNLFGSSNDRIVKSMQPLVQQINDREANFASLDDDAIRAMVGDIRQKITDGASKDDFLLMCLRWFVKPPNAPLASVISMSS